MEMTPELLLKLYPGAYWSVYRAGFAEAKNDPGTRKQIAEEYLKGEFVRGSSAASVTPPRGPASQALHLSRPVDISPEQARVNAQLGVSPEVFVKFNHETPSRLDETQQAVNKQLGLNEQTFAKYAR